MGWWTVSVEEEGGGGPGVLTAPTSSKLGVFLTMWKELSRIIVMASLNSHHSLLLRRKRGGLFNQQI